MSDDRLHLLALGRELRRLRGDATQDVVAALADVSPNHVSRLEHGGCRTRASTLNRLARAFVKLRPELGPSRPLALRLERLAGRGLAPEWGSLEHLAQRDRFIAAARQRQQEAGS
mgnify:CR=1 FL=1